MGRALKFFVGLLVAAATVGLADDGCASGSAWAPYVEALDAADGGDDDTAVRLLREALEIRQMPIARPSTRCLGGNPYVPYLHLADTLLRQGAVDDAELSLAISEAFEAYRKKRSTRRLHQRVHAEIERRRTPVVVAAELTQPSDPESK